MKLSEESIQFLLNTISKSTGFNKDQFYILNKLIRPDIAEYNNDNISAHYIDWFQEHRISDLSFLNFDNTSKIKGINSFMRVLPIGYFQLCPYKCSKLEAGQVNFINLFHNFSKKSGKEIANCLQNNFPEYDIVPHFCLIPSLNVGELYKDFIKSVKHEADKHSIKVKLKQV